MRAINGLSPLIRVVRRIAYISVLIISTATCLGALACWLFVDLALPPTGWKDEYSRGIYDEFGTTHLHTNEWGRWLDVTIFQRVTVELRFSIGPDNKFGGGPSRIEGNLCFPADGLHIGKSRNLNGRGFSFHYGASGTYSSHSFDLFIRPPGEVSSIQMEMDRTGLSLEEVRELVNIPRVYLSVGLPLWFVSLVSGMFPSVAFLRGPVRRWRRKRKGLCVACGYNLQGNMSGVCSECGKSVIAKGGNALSECTTERP